MRRLLGRLQETLALLEDKERFSRHARSLREELRAAGPLEPLEMRLKELNAHSIVLLTKELPRAHRDRVEGDTRLVNDEFEELRSRTARAAEAPGSDRHEGEFRALQAEVAGIESQLLGEHAVASTRQEMVQKAEELKRLRARFDGLQSTYEAVVRERRQNYDTGSVPDLNLRSSVENLVTKFTDCKTILHQKILEVEKGTSQ